MRSSTKVERVGSLVTIIKERMVSMEVKMGLYDGIMLLTLTYAVRSGS